MLETQGRDLEPEALSSELPLQPIHEAELNEVCVEGGHALGGDVRRHLGPVMGTMMAQMDQDVGDW